MCDFSKFFADALKQRIKKEIRAQIFKSCSSAYL